MTKRQRQGSAWSLSLCLFLLYSYYFFVNRHINFVLDKPCFSSTADTFSQLFKKQETRKSFYLVHEILQKREVLILCYTLFFFLSNIESLIRFIDNKFLLLKFTPSPLLLSFSPGKSACQLADEKTTESMSLLSLSSPFFFFPSKNLTFSTLMNVNKMLPNTFWHCFPKMTSALHYKKGLPFSRPQPNLFYSVLDTSCCAVCKLKGRHLRIF